MSRKQKEAESRRLFILEAARRLFAERGIDKPNMDEIAAAAEYTRQTLYSYFRSRDEILLRVLSGDLRARWARQQEALDKTKGSLPRLRVWAECLIAHWREHPHAMRMEMFWDYHGIEPGAVGEDAMEDFVQINEELAGGLRAMIESGVADGSLRADLDTEMCLSQFVQCLRAAAYRALTRSYSFAEFDSKAYLEHFLDLWFAGIRGGDAGDEEAQR
jgi:TetR/AcrR family transcriptional regulator